MKAYVRDIKTEEGKPKLSAYDPYFETRFGFIEFTVGKVKLLASLADRCADDLRLEKDGKRRWIRMSMEQRTEFHKLTQSLWNVREAEIELPEWLQEAIA